MHFIKQGPTPVNLGKNQDIWTKPWVNYYTKKKNGSLTKNDKKPTTSHWLKDDIRKPLISDFKNNCGYCGVCTPSTLNEETTKGDVDHLLPKSEYPTLVYEWSNYVWSCKPCNQVKREFHSKTFPLLSPFNFDDCQLIVFIQETGCYALKSNVNNNGERRLQNTEQHTLLNSVEISKERRNKITILNQGIKSILQYQELLKVQPKISSESLIEFFQTKIIEEKRNIMEQLKLPNFKRLTHEHYLKLLEKYPNLTKI